MIPSDSEGSWNDPSPNSWWSLYSIQYSCVYNFIARKRTKFCLINSLISSLLDTLWNKSSNPHLLSSSSLPQLFPNPSFLTICLKPLSPHPYSYLIKSLLYTEYQHPPSYLIKSLWTTEYQHLGGGAFSNLMALLMPLRAIKFLNAPRSWYLSNSRGRGRFQLLFFHNLVSAVSKDLIR